MALAELVLAALGELEVNMPPYSLKETVLKKRPIPPSGFRKRRQ